MIIDYFQWQFVLAPSWLLRLMWNLERASLRLFSIKLMFQTLTAHWHKDAMAWKGGTIGKYVATIMWNIISRLIGFIVRSTVITLWIIMQAIFIPLAFIIFILFITWPFLVIIGISTGLSLLVVV